ncbi:MAG: hypothetical protein V3U35_04950 [Candidatus Neomarinimicrobiota bacterium]
MRKLRRTSVVWILAFALGNIVLAQEPQQVVITMSNGMTVQGIIVMHDSNAVQLQTSFGEYKIVPTVRIKTIMQAGQDVTAQFVPHIILYQPASGQVTADSTRIEPASMRRPQPLILRKGIETVTIPAGRWVVAVDSFGREIIGRGALVGVSGTTVIIQGKDRHVIPLQHIGILYDGHAREVGRSTRTGLKRGAVAGLVGGLALGGLAWLDQRGNPALTFRLGGYLILGPIGISIITIPGGALIGSLDGLAKDSQAVAYPLGQGQWEIVAE